MLAGLILVIGLWTTRAVPQWTASLLLLLLFATVGRTPLEKVFQFPLSENFWMIAFSYLFSQGLQNSGVFYRLLPLLSRVKNLPALFLSIFLSSTLMIWLIPQPFARIAVLLQLYTTVFQAWGISEELRKLLCFWIVNSSILINSAFLRGDIVLNQALCSVSGLTMTESLWMTWMLFPTLCLYVFGSLLYCVLFQKTLRQLPAIGGEKTAAPLRPTRDRPALIIATATVMLWLTEPLTGLPAVYPAGAASAALAMCGYLGRTDLRCVNLNLMLFLTAAFSIGPTMVNNGIVDQLLPFLLPLLPKRFDLWCALWIVLSSMALHMILGSCVTAISITIPTLLALCQGSLSAYPIAFLAFQSIAVQYLLPFHNVSLMVGESTGRYSSGTVFRFGAAMTVLEVAAIPVLYCSCWAWLGLR